MGHGLSCLLVEKLLGVFTAPATRLPVVKLAANQKCPSCWSREHPMHVMENWSLVLVGPGRGAKVEGAYGRGAVV